MSLYAIFCNICDDSIMAEFWKCATWHYFMYSQHLNKY